MEQVKIIGTVTDFNGTPLEGADVSVKGDFFEELYETLTDNEGKFSLVIAKGKYVALYACKDYKEKFLEYWFWDFAPEKDMEIDIKIDKLEVYGLKAWSPYSGWCIFFRPMSLSRSKEYEALGKSLDHVQIAPELKKENIKVTIDGYSLDIYQVDKVKERTSVKRTMDAYLIQVSDLPDELPTEGQKMITVTIHDQERNEFGMGSTFTQMHNRA